MYRSRVALVRCNDYDEGRVYTAVKRGITLLGEVSDFAKPSEKIVMKPNVLIGSNPEKCVTTHPAVMKAVGRLLQEAGAEVSYGDSPSFGGCASNMKRAGLKQVGDEPGFTLADFNHGREVSHKTALLNKKFYLPQIMPFGPPLWLRRRHPLTESLASPRFPGSSRTPGRCS